MGRRLRPNAPIAINHPTVAAARNADGILRQEQNTAVMSCLTILYGRAEMAIEHPSERGCCEEHTAAMNPAHLGEPPVTICPKCGTGWLFDDDEADWVLETKEW